MNAADVLRDAMTDPSLTALARPDYLELVERVTRGLEAAEAADTPSQGMSILISLHPAMIRLAEELKRLNAERQRSNDDRNA